MFLTEYEEWYEYGLDLAKQGGKMMLDAFHKEKKIDTKLTFADMVTETDKAIEKFIFDNIQKKYKGHICLGEESENKPQWSDDPTWILDPIDGTTNFIHQFPYSAVSLAVSINKKIIIGIVYNPMLDLMYTAKCGQGAFCNGKRLHASKAKAMKESLIFTEVGSLREPNIFVKKIENYKKIGAASHGIRSMGSAALNLCFVACGQGDAGYEYGIHIWDMAAGVLIVTEAGGLAMDPSGGELDLLSRKFLVAGSPELGRELCSLLTPIEFERD